MLPMASCVEQTSIFQYVYAEGRYGYFHATFLDLFIFPVSCFEIIIVREFDNF